MRRYMKQKMTDVCDSVTPRRKDKSFQSDGWKETMKERERYTKTGQTGNQRGILCEGDDISRAVKVALMIRHKQEREGLPLPRSECSLHHKERAGGLFHKNRRRESAHCPPTSSSTIVTLSADPAAQPSLVQSVSTLRAASKANKQGPPQYLRKQLFLPLE